MLWNPNWRARFQSVFHMLIQFRRWVRHLYSRILSYQSNTCSPSHVYRDLFLSLSLHLTFLNEAVADQNVPDIKAGVKKMTQEVHNCKDTFSKIAEFSEAPNRCEPGVDENGKAEAVNNALIYAAAGGSLLVVKKLFKKRGDDIDVNAVASSGQTAL